MGNQETEQRVSFEGAMDKLEQIVSQLEEGDTPLEQAVELFQTGMQLSKLCAEKLEQIERKIEQVTEQNGEWRRQPYVTEGTRDFADESLS